MSVTTSADGSRTVHLFIPLQSLLDNKIVIRAVTLEDVIRWQAGEFSSPLALLAMLCGIAEPILMTVRYPDADRLLGEFAYQLPDAIRDDVMRSNRIGRTVEPGTETMQGGEGAPSGLEGGDDPSLGLEGLDG